MKKLTKTLCAVAIAMFAMPQQADAQFFKKLKEAAANVVKETITGETTTESDGKAAGDAAPSTNFVTSASGVSVGNPAAQYFDLQFVEAVGNSAANTVTIYLKATAKDLNYANVQIGNNTVVGYDTDGNEYKSNNYALAKNLTVGLPVKYEISSLANVPSTVNTLAVVYVGWYINSSKAAKGGNLSTNIQLKNVPVKWQ